MFPLQRSKKLLVPSNRTLQFNPVNCIMHTLKREKATAWDNISFPSLLLKLKLSDKGKEKCISVEGRNSTFQIDKNLCWCWNYFKGHFNCIFYYDIIVSFFYYFVQHIAQNNLQTVHLVYSPWPEIGFEHGINYYTNNQLNRLILHRGKKIAGQEFVKKGSK